MKNNKIAFIKFIFIILVTATVFLNLQEITQGASQAVNVCINIIIPSLFPMLLITSIITSAEIPAELRKISHQLTCRAFGLSGNCLTSIITGLFCGYNCAVLSSLNLYNEKRITKEEAFRISVFFTSPGFSFCVIIAGVTFYNSYSIGILMLLSNISACIITAAIYNLLYIKKPITEAENINHKTKISLSENINMTTETLLRICSWVTLFYCFLPLLKKLTFFAPFSVIFSLFAEVTSGLSFSIKNYNIYAAVLSVSFGGICILLQQLPVLKKLDIKPAIMILSRIVISFLSCLLFYLFIKLFAVEIEAINMHSDINLYYNSFSGSLSLLLLCAVIICYIISDRKQFISQ